MTLTRACEKPGDGKLSFSIFYLTFCGQRPIKILHL